MMLLSELTKGNSALITKIDADPALKRRLGSLGIVRGETLTVKGCSLAKQTMEIEVEGTLIALREAEANKIHVTKNG